VLLILVAASLVFEGEKIGERKKGKGRGALHGVSSPHQHAYSPLREGRRRDPGRDRARVVSVCWPGSLRLGRKKKKRRGNRREGGKKEKDLAGALRPSTSGPSRRSVAEEGGKKVRRGGIPNVG